MENKLNLINFISNDYNSLEKRFNIFYNADICIIPHGGAAFHIYGCKPHTKIIEFISSKGTPICDIGKLAPYLELNYNVLLVDGYHNGNGYIIDINKLEDILNNINIVKLERNNNYFNNY